MFVTRCSDDVCNSSDLNGIFRIEVNQDGKGESRRVRVLPYAWGVQPVDALNLFIFTDGEDILAIPLQAVEQDLTLGR